MKTVQDLAFPKKELAEVRINAAGRVTFINPPPHLAKTLRRAASGVYEIGKANQLDFYIESPIDDKARRDLCVRLAKRAIDHSQEAGRVSENPPRR